MRGRRGGSKRRDVSETRSDSTSGTAERFSETFTAVPEGRIGMDDGK